VVVAAFVPSFLIMLVCFTMVLYLMSTGVGVWGLMIPVGWAWDITNFVFWIGIGHAGTLISAILFLLRQRWRTSINRAAEAMTIFAVICAGLFPLIHIGRIWLGWWLLPLPNANSIWPQFRSPLLWDVFAVSTYFTVSLLFWYMGLIPDLATMRDRAKSKIRQILYGLGALGWTGSNRHWSNYEKSLPAPGRVEHAAGVVGAFHRLLRLRRVPSSRAGIPPSFLLTLWPGAIFSGFGMVLSLLIPMRSLCHLQEIITVRHVELMGKVILATGSMVGYAYAMEFFIAWYSGNPYERFAFMRNRAADPFILAPLWGVEPAPYWWAYWTHDQLQRHLSAAVLVQESPDQHGHRFYHLHLREHRDVVRTFCHHRDVVASRLHAQQLGLLHSDLGGYLAVHRDVWFVPDLLPAFHCDFLPAIAISEVKGVVPQADPHHPLGGAKGGTLTMADLTVKYGLLAEFETAADILGAAAKVRDAGYRRWDVYTPTQCMAWTKPWVLKKVAGGLVHVLLWRHWNPRWVYLMIWWMNAADYAITVGGKPLFSPIYGFPVAYECTILLGRSVR
jgi:molybdopterin-containing oxidoreductase family membrane subunit